MTPEAVKGIVRGVSFALNGYYPHEQRIKFIKSSVLTIIGKSGVVLWEIPFSTIPHTYIGGDYFPLAEGVVFEDVEFWDFPSGITLWLTFDDGSLYPITHICNPSK